MTTANKRIDRQANISNNASYVSSLKISPVYCRALLLDRRTVLFKQSKHGFICQQNGYKKIFPKKQRIMSNNKMLSYNTNEQ